MTGPWPGVGRGYPTQVLDLPAQLGSVTCGMLRSWSPGVALHRAKSAPLPYRHTAIHPPPCTYLRCNRSALSLSLLPLLATALHRAYRILSSRDHRRADAFCAESSLPREPSCAPPLSHVHYVLGGPRLCWTPVHADGSGPTLTCAQTAPRECRNASTTRSRARSARLCRWHPRGRRPARPPA